MVIRYDPSLMEEVVMLTIRREEEKGNLTPFSEYRVLVDPTYEKFQPHIREAEFEKLHGRLFLRWGFGEILAKALEEYPELGGIDEVFFGRATTPHEEGADLSRDRRRVGIKLRGVRFFEPQGFLRYLQHELEHIADLLDPAFGYDEEGFLGHSLSEVNLMKDRYRMIWSIVIDGRLERQGKEPGTSKEERWLTFDTLYQKIPYPQRLAIFENLWEADRLSHGEILAMAKDPVVLLQRAGKAADQEGPPRKVLLPGSLCPLCRFPTFLWADGLREGPQEILESLKRDFPLWTLEEGACERCVEVYRVRAGVCV